MFIGSTIQTLSQRVSKHRGKLNIKPHCTTCQRTCVHVATLGIPTWALASLNSV